MNARVAETNHAYVRQSVCRRPDPTSRMETPSETTRYFRVRSDMPDECLPAEIAIGSYLAVGNSISVLDPRFMFCRRTNFDNFCTRG
jgi:hypothetical protein